MVNASKMIDMAKLTRIMQNDSADQPCNTSQPDSASISFAGHVIGKPFSKDYVSYIVRSIVGHALDLEDRVAENATDNGPGYYNFERDYCEPRFKGQAEKISSLEDIKPRFYKSVEFEEHVPLQKLKEFFIKKITGDVEEVYEKIKNRKGIKSLVEDFAKCLAEYDSGSGNCESCLSRFLNLKKDIRLEVDKVYRRKYGLGIKNELAADLLGFVFVKEAVEKFQSKILESYGKRESLVEMKEDLRLLLDSFDEKVYRKLLDKNLYEDAKRKLMYGFGLYANNVERSRCNEGSVFKWTTSGLRIVEALSAVSLWRLLDIGGKMFEIVNTTTSVDGNSTSRALSGAGTECDANGYVVVQNTILQAAKEIINKNMTAKEINGLEKAISLLKLRKCKTIEDKLFVLSSRNKREKSNGAPLKGFLKEYIESRKDGAVEEVSSFELECLLAAYGMRRKILVIDSDKDGNRKYFLFGNDLSISEIKKLGSKKITKLKNEGAIFLASMYGHAMALIPLEEEDRHYGYYSYDDSQESSVEDSQGTGTSQEEHSSVGNLSSEESDHHVYWVGEFYDNIEDIRHTMFDVVCDRGFADKLKVIEVVDKFFGNVLDVIERSIEKKKHSRLKKLRSSILKLKDDLNKVEGKRGGIDDIDRELRGGIFKSGSKDKLRQIKVKKNSIGRLDKQVNDKRVELWFKGEEYCNELLGRAIEICKSNPLFWPSYMTFMKKQILSDELDILTNKAYGDPFHVE